MTSFLPPLPLGIYDRLRADATLVGSFVGGAYTGILQGGVWDIPLKRDGPRNTEAAFYLTQKGRMIRPTAVVLDDGDEPHGQADAVPTAYEGTVTVQLFCPPTAGGKAAMWSATDRIITLLYGGGGYRWLIAPSLWAIVDGDQPSRDGQHDSETIVGAKEDRLFVTVRSRRRDEG
jgi:hypothetical protein